MADAGAVIGLAKSHSTGGDVVLHLGILRTRLTDDRGAIGLIFAIVVGSGVLFGLLALSVDVGNIYTERRVVQNAADAAAVSGAMKCAKGECAQVTVQSLTSGYTNPSSPDLKTAVSSLCIKQPGSSGCTSVGAKVLDCRAVPSNLSKYVRVYTRSLDPSGSSLLIPWISNAIATSINSGTTVTACSQAAWGTVKTVPVYYPFALPACGYEEDEEQNFKELPSTNSGDTRWAGCSVTDHEGIVNQFPNSPTGFVQVTLPGVSSCEVSTPISIGQVLQINTANDQHLCGSSQTAIPALLRMLEQPRYIPVVDAGTSNTVTVRFFVQFRLKAFYYAKTGYPNVAPYNTSTFWNNQTPSCNNKAGKDCLYGIFEPAVYPGGEIDPNAPALGIQAVRPLP